MTVIGINIVGEYILRVVDQLGLTVDPPTLQL